LRDTRKGLWKALVLMDFPPWKKPEGPAKHYWAGKLGIRVFGNKRRSYSIKEGNSLGRKKQRRALKTLLFTLDPRALGQRASSFLNIPILLGKTFGQGLIQGPATASTQGKGLFWGFGKGPGPIPPHLFSWGPRFSRKKLFGGPQLT